MSKRLLISLLILGTVISLATYGVTTSIGANEGGYSNPVISRLAEQFSLEEDEVEAVLITETQKNALIAKWDEMQEKHEQERQEMQNWFEEQGIDPVKLAPYGGFGHHGGFK